MQYNLDDAKKNIESILFALEDCAHQTEMFGRVDDELGERIDRLLSKIRWPEEGEFWKHNNGSTYKVIALTNKESESPEKYPLTVVYENTETGAVWSRPYARWSGSFVRVDADK